MKNKYIKRSHVTEKKFRQILRYFTKDYTAEQTADTTGISRITVNRLYAQFRLRIAGLLERRGKLSGEVEVDESYFGARRVRGKRGRGAKGKVPVVGLLKRHGKVYTQIISNCTKEQLMPILRGKILSKSTVYTDGWTSYDSLIFHGYKHHRIHHHDNEFARGKNHVNGIESFWSYAKRRLLKFNGIHKTKFLLHLKESEFRWNMRITSVNMYQELLKNFREKPL
ncbi:transposase [Candidatus Curtissbacteria bacterium RBG_13_40_7]|uniref:Transposase n=1 Tax=Candidatus Curtissbacteria bacterium RBG_13_40_7 TaxID=1797706 RepID=A0A1F5FYG8_9BACT|nr:MAG: transposase [Candidatus Curtissbacteria bacterium RBG_13_40_7]